MAASQRGCCYFQLRDLMWRELMRVCTLSLSDLCQDGHTKLGHGFQNKTGYRRYPGLFSTKEHISLTLVCLRVI